jgi:hypothetical protein
MVPFRQVSKEKTCKGRNTQSSSDTLPSVRFKSRKRVFAEHPPIDRSTRSKESFDQPAAIPTPPSNDGTQATIEG